MIDVEFIGVGGPSCSGKSTLCKSYPTAQVIHFDDYYRDEPVKEGGENNFEHPDNFLYNELERDLEKIKSGEIGSIPIFDKTRFERVGYRTIKPDNPILVEGFLLFYDESVRDLLDTKIWIDVDEETQRERRERKYGHFKNGYFDDFVLPTFEEFGEPTRRHADHTLNGSKTFDKLLEEFKSLIKQVA